MVSPYFLNKPLYFYLLLAVIATTLVSWLQVNSWLIILLVGFRLLDGRLDAIRAAFLQPRFLACFVFFLLAVASLLHTHDLRMAWMHVESKATWVAVPFIVCGGPFVDGRGLRRLLWAYCLLLAGLSVCCLGVAVVHYVQTGDVDVFFYHALTEVFGSNAVYFSAYVLTGLLYLLSSPAATRPRGRVAMIVLFTGMMILLASKLLLVLLAVVYGIHLWRRAQAMKAPRLLALTAILVLGSGVLAFTDNPVERRYTAILNHPQPTTPDGRPVYNGISLRTFIWRDAVAILNEEHAWVFGVSYGDCQRLLDRKYLDAGMSRGYLGYNYHNEYVEVLVSSGIVGLCLFLAVLALLLPPFRGSTMEGRIVFLVVVLLACTESSLEMQQPAFFSCFFLLLPWGVAGKEIGPGSRAGHRAHSRRKDTAGLIPAARKA